MSILIKGMEMPETCRDCRLSTVRAFDERPLCDVLVRYMSYGEWEAKRLDNCPLVPVPPHGRLIDADANIATLKKCEGNPESDIAKICYGYAAKIMDACPTIIEAEEGE